MAVTMLGRGLYDATEVARLLGHDIEWVVRWTTKSKQGKPVVSPSFERMFSFEDLVGLRVALRVRSCGVSDAHLRRGVETLREITGLENPLATRRVIGSLATSGHSFLSDLSGEFEDIGQRRQRVFQEIVRVDITRVTFDDHGEARRWTPWRGVVLDPAIQAGAPCIAGTRVPTAVVAELAADADTDDLALDFNVSSEAVENAIAFEQSLSEGVGLAA
jgi:uncharacterized protein (DUF433 family)